MYKIDLHRSIKSASVLRQTPEGRAVLAEERRLKHAIRQAEEGGPLINISKTPASLEWFVDDRIQDNKISPAEKMISAILDMYNVEYVQEVSMYGLQLPSFGYARYDWLLQVDRPYILCEYDGKSSHSTEYHIRRDKLKTQWCEKMGIKLLRWSTAEYYHMEDIIEKLMKGYRIKRKGT